MAPSIEPLDCGTLAAGRSMFELGASDDPVELPVPAWLIRHPAGIVLFDTGMHPDLTGPGGLTDTVALFFDVSVDQSQLVAGRLEAAGVDARDVDIVVLSHLHFDHTGGLGQIPDARVVIQRDEWDAGADRDLAAANHFRAEEYQLGHDVVLIDGEHDVFGDGTITCLPTPGHTPGHQSLRVRRSCLRPTAPTSPTRSTAGHSRRSATTRRSTPRASRGSARWPPPVPRSYPATTRHTWPHSRLASNSRSAVAHDNRADTLASPRHANDGATSLPISN